MAIPKYRGEFVSPTDQINLAIQFKNNQGVPTDTDLVPSISIVSPSGLVILTNTSAGITRIGTGTYQYTFTVPYNGPYGVFQDNWIGYVNGERIDATYEFIVSYSDLPGPLNSDGYVHLGDDPGFHYSQAAIKNINKLIKLLKARLNSSGKVKGTDSFGNVMYVDCDIYSIEMLTNFLAMALAEFNQIPHFTFFEFDDDAFVAQFAEILVKGATVYALASQALIERGREFTIGDNGITFNPPTISELLNTQFQTQLTDYRAVLDLIKKNMKPFPKGLGVFGMTSGMNPQFTRLRHLRERKFY